MGVAFTPDTSPSVIGPSGDITALPLLAATGRRGFACRSCSRRPAANKLLRQITPLQGVRVALLRRPRGVPLLLEPNQEVNVNRSKSHNFMVGRYSLIQL